MKWERQILREEQRHRLVHLDPSKSWSPGASPCLWLHIQGSVPDTTIPLPVPHVICVTQSQMMLAAFCNARRDRLTRGLNQSYYTYYCWSNESLSVFHVSTPRTLIFLYSFTMFNYNYINLTIWSIFSISSRNLSSR